MATRTTSVASRRSAAMVPSWAQLVKYLEAASDVSIGGSGLRRWTRRMIRSIGSRCPPGLVPYPKVKRRGTSGEYLVDLVWSREPEGRKGHPSPWEEYRGLVLAMECEWGGTTERLWEDLIKLADVRADRRMMVGNLWPYDGYGDFRAGRGPFVRGVRKFLKRHVHFERDDELLVALWEKGNDDDLVAWLFDGAGNMRRVNPAPSFPAGRPKARGR